VEEGVAPFSLEELGALFGPVGQAGLAWVLAGREPEAPLLREMAAAGRALPAAALFAAVDGIGAFRRRMAAFFLGWDLILTPAAAALPWPAAEVAPGLIDGQAVGPRGHAVFTNFANLGALPGIALPCRPAANGLPIGMQVVGAAGADGVLCAMAAEWEACAPWADRWPTLA
jgi:aspartyl-tRNA(Asn)/glutamyl-tRNA(Gln) amidotransferase subunit A